MYIQAEELFLMIILISAETCLSLFPYFLWHVHYIDPYFPYTESVELLVIHKVKAKCLSIIVSIVSKCFEHCRIA